MYGPCILLVVISWVSFWLNREATSDRISLGELPIYHHIDGIIITFTVMKMVSSSSSSASPPFSWKFSYHHCLHSVIINVYILHFDDVIKSFHFGFPFISTSNTAFWASETDGYNLHFRNSSSMFNQKNLFLCKALKEWINEISNIFDKHNSLCHLYCRQESQLCWPWHFWALKQGRTYQK